MFTVREIQVFANGEIEICVYKHVRVAVIACPPGHQSRSYQRL